MAVDPKTKLSLPCKCGKCFDCRREKSFEWFNRLSLEAKQWRGLSTFLTITYYTKCLSRNTQGVPVLDRSHLIKFFKRVRTALSRQSQLPKQIRYYYVGEYGPSTNRPHYHVVLFGLPPTIQARKFLYHCWDMCDFNQFKMTELTDARMRYCVGYATSKMMKNQPLISDTQWWWSKGLTPPFNGCSRHPGIGHNYLSEDMVNYHRTHELRLIPLDGKFRPMPRYYRDRIWDRYERRKFLDDYVKQLHPLLDINGTSYDYIDCNGRVVFPEPSGYYALASEKGAQGALYSMVLSDIGRPFTDTMAYRLASDSMQGSYQSKKCNSAYTIIQ